MMMEGERRNNFIANGHYSYNSNGHCGRFCNDYSLFDKDNNNNNNQSLASPTLPSAGFIQHPVSRFDTLAGVAIKYGVEVADIKKMNGLVTDLQMFGLKSIQIPLPGRHPPSPCLLNASNSNTPGPGQGQNSTNQTTSKHMSPDWLDSFQSLRLKSPRMVSPEMSSIQGYYNLKEIEKKTMSEAFEMVVYRKGQVYLDDGSFVKPSNPLPRLKRKCKSVANGFYDQNGEILVEIISAGEGKEGEPDKSNEKRRPLVRRRQKSEADFTKHLTLRMKGGIRMNVRGVAAAKGEVVRFNPMSTTVGDEYVVDGLGEVRKSSSTSCLHDRQESNSSNGSSSSSLSSLWPSASKLQALSTRPIFDGLSARKNKAALD